MRRPLVLIMLMLSAFWQSVAVGGQLPAFERGDHDHALMHWEGEAHHHHDDGSVSEDDSDDSVRHLMADASIGAVALWSEPPSVAVMPSSVPRISADRRSIRSADPDPLRRPPRPSH